MGEEMSQLGRRGREQARTEERGDCEMFSPLEGGDVDRSTPLNLTRGECEGRGGRSKGA